MRRTQSRRTAPQRTQQPRGILRRARTLEILEGRQMLSASPAQFAPLQNRLNPNDVNCDGHVSTADALVVVNDLLRNGPHAVAPIAAPLAATAGVASATKFMDVNGDNMITTIDALRVVNRLLSPLQQTPSDARIRLIATDLSGVEITEITEGDSFLIQARVQDLRASAARFGVAEMSISYLYPSASTSVASQAAGIDPFVVTPQGQPDVSVPGTVASVFALNSNLFASTQAEVGVWTMAFQTEDVQDDVGATFSPFVGGGDGILFLTEDTTTSIELLPATLTIKNIPDKPQISIADFAKAEGNSSFTDFVFNVTINTATDLPVTVNYQTFAGGGSNGAQDNTDFTPTQGTVTIAAGQTSAPITVKVVGDTTAEPNEIFNVVLSSPSTNADLFDTTADITITNDDASSVINTFANQSVKNVLTGTTTMNFTVSLAAPAGGPVTVRYQTEDITANSQDYEPASGTLSFAAGDSTRTIPITIKGDADTGNETFRVVLTPLTNVVINDNEAIGTIEPAVAVPTLFVDDIIGSEGNVTTSNFVFTARLSEAPPTPVVVRYQTADGTAQVSDSDYVAATGFITFDANNLTRTFTIAVNGDTKVEPSETFAVNLTRESGAVLANSATGTATINNDDGAPTLTIGDVTILSSPTGAVEAVFSVTLSRAVTQQVTVGFATQDNSAVASKDYLPQSGLLTFRPGESLTQTISVTILAQPTPTDDKSFFVTLSSPSPGADILDGFAVGTIVTQGLSISSANVVEGQTGTTNAVFTVSLSKSQPTPVVVRYSTSNGTGADAATAPSDYEATSGTITFQANDNTPQLVTVRVNGDTTEEANETFFIQLTDAVGVNIFNSTGTGTILNDDGDRVLVRLQLNDDAGNELAPNEVLDVGDTIVLQGYVRDLQADAGIFQAFVDVLYDSNLVALDGPITFGPDFSSLNTASTATAGLLDEIGAIASPEGGLPGGVEQLFFSVQFTVTDFGQASFIPAFAANQGQANIGHEILVFTSNTPVPEGAVNFEDVAINIGRNVISVKNVSQQEGSGGQTAFVFEVTRFLANGADASVNYATRPGTAIEGTDYAAASGQILFDGEEEGNVTKLITILVNGDQLDEPDETFFIDLSAATGATASNSPGRGLIVDDDAPVGVSIANTSGKEGEQLAFTVTLSAVSGQTVTVPYTTAQATSGIIASADIDYTPTSGALTFAPGVTQRTILVSALPDDLVDANETFRVLLDAAGTVNGTVTSGAAVGTIIDVPPAIIAGFVYVDADGNGFRDPGEAPIQGVVIRAHRNGDPDTKYKETVTNADGSFELIGLPAPGTYAVREIHPAFYGDGIDSRNGVISATNDLFTDVTVAPSQRVDGLLFGETIRAEFADLLRDRRALFASSQATGILGPGDSTVDLSHGDVWIAFNEGWKGMRIIEALYPAGSTGTTMTLYDYNLQPVADSIVSTGGCSLTYTNFTDSPFFLKITGTLAPVTLRVTETVTVFDVTQNEGSGVPSNFVFVVSLSARQSSAVSVQYSTSAGSAGAIIDYASKTGSVTFAPGETAKTVTISVVGDSANELNEQFYLNLANASGIQLGRSKGIGTITNDDATGPASRFAKPTVNSPLVIDAALAANDDWTG